MLLLAIALLAEVRYGSLSRLAPGGDRGRSRLARSSSGWAPLALGVVFGTAFTPCVGPFLGATLSLAASQGGALRGGVLLAVYAAGLGVPFVVASLAVSGSPPLARRLSRLAGPVSVLGAALLVVLGLALVTGRYGQVSGWLAHANPLS